MAEEIGKQLLADHQRDDALFMSLPESDSASIFIAEVTASGQLCLIDASAPWLELMKISAWAPGDCPKAVKDNPYLRELFQQLQLLLQGGALTPLSEGLAFSIEQRQLHITLMPVVDAEGLVQRIVGNTRDVSHEQKAKERHERINRQLKALSECNQVMMRAHDEASLLSDVCRIICDVARYHMAWVGYPEDKDETPIRPVAWAGEEQGYLSEVERYLQADNPQGCELSVEALRTGATTLIEDFREAIQAKPWYEAALSRGYHRAIALPLKDSMGVSCAVLTVYVGNGDLFTLEERMLLEKLSGDLAFTINLLRTRLEKKRTEIERLSNLKFFESMDKVSRAIQQASDLDQMMSDVLDQVLEIFDCDRAYLLHPCDPDAPTWKVPMERTKPAYPGVLALGLEMEMTEEVSNSFRFMLENDGPVQFGPGAAYSVPPDVEEHFQVKSFMSLALYPKMGLPWQFGIHQCSSARIWSPNEERIMHEIGLRLADGLTSMLSFHARKESEGKLREAERQFHTLVDNLPSCIARFNRKGEAVYLNPAAEKTFGSTEACLLGATSAEIGVSGDNDNLLISERIGRAFREGVANSVEIQWNTLQGRRFFDVLHVPERDEEGRVSSVLGIAHDITERKHQQEQLLYQAHFDPLTDLPNRLLAMDRLQQNIRMAARNDGYTALLFLDLDDFKKVNDALGHEVGDQVLKLAASRLRQVVRSSDTLARLGGDEFIILIHEVVDSDAVRPVAEKIVQAFQEVFLVMGREVMLTASLGISIYPDDGSDPKVLLSNADTSKYQAKAKVRNAYQFFTKSMNLDAARRLQIEEQMRLALGRDEFHLKYQPIIKISNGAIVGVEALLRWRNPILGDVSIPDFIEVAEQTGFIIDLGRWVIETALADMQLWKSHCDKEFRLSLNVSPRQFRQVGFAADLKRAMERVGVRGEQLEIEITEGILLGGEVGAAEVISQLRDLGVNIAMDDFGTGYSSLSYLRNYRFDSLKIDRVFIQDIIDDANDRELIIATLRMARGLGVKVVAEGVETAEQLAFLRQQGCDYAQGFLLSRPVMAEVITNHLEGSGRLGITS